MNDDDNLLRERVATEAEINRLQNSLNDLQKTAHELALRFERVEKINELQDRDYQSIHAAMSALKLSIEKFDSWKDQAGPYLLQSDRSKQDVTRVENKISNLYESINKLERVVEQNTFYSKRAERDTEALIKEMADLEKNIEERMNVLLSVLREDYVSKRELLSQQKNFLWGLIAFIFTSVVGWILSKL